MPEMIRCASLNGTNLLGFENGGAIEAGKNADFIVVEGDPLQLPNSLNNIEALYINGEKQE